MEETETCPDQSRYPEELDVKLGDLPVEYDSEEHGATIALLALSEQGPVGYLVSAALCRGTLRCLKLVDHRVLRARVQWPAPEGSAQLEGLPDPLLTMVSSFEPREAAILASLYPSDSQLRETQRLVDLLFGALQLVETGAYEFAIAPLLVQFARQHEERLASKVDGWAMPWAVAYRINQAVDTKVSQSVGDSGELVDRLRRCLEMEKLTLTVPRRADDDEGTMLLELLRLLSGVVYSLTPDHPGSGRRQRRGEPTATRLTLDERVLGGAISTGMYTPWVVPLFHNIDRCMRRREVLRTRELLCMRDQLLSTLINEELHAGNSAEQQQQGTRRPTLRGDEPYILRIGQLPRSALLYKTFNYASDYMMMGDRDEREHALPESERLWRWLDHYLGGYLEFLDLSRSCLTGSLIPYLSAPNTRYSRLLTIPEDPEAWHQDALRLQWNAHFILVASSTDEELEDCPPAGSAFDVLSQAHRYPFKVVEGADVDIAVQVSTTEELAEVAHQHLEAIRHKFPDARLCQVERPNGFMFEIREPTMRTVQVYMADQAQILSHHVAMTRGWITGNGEEREMYVSASCLWSLIKSVNTNYNYFAGAKGPETVIAKYHERGYDMTAHCSEELASLINSYLEHHSLPQTLWRMHPLGHFNLFDFRQLRRRQRW